MLDDSPKKCPNCGYNMCKKINTGYLIHSLKPSLADLRESDHTKKVKDKERAITMRKKAFGHDSVGNPVDKSDPKHIIKRGRVLGGQQLEIDKKDFIKAAAKDPGMVEVAKNALKKT